MHKDFKLLPIAGEAIKMTKRTLAKKKPTLGQSVGLGGSISVKDFDDLLLGHEKSYFV
jgi:hypothetical protein